MKRWTTIALTAALISATALTGCGKQDAGPSSTPDNSVQPAPGGEKVKLTIGSWRTEDTEAYKKIIKEFNKTNPDIEIEFKPTKNTEYNTVLNTALQTGSGPDIIHLRPYAAGRQLADGGYLEPIDNLKGIDVFSKDTLLAATGSDGKLYGVPTVFSSTQIFYNKKIFEQYSLQEPKTWDELIQVAEKLKENKVTPFAFGSKEGWILSLTHGALGPSVYGGSDFVDKVTSGEAKLTDPAFVDSVKMMQELAPYFPDNYIGLGMDDMRNLFVTEQAGMFVMGDWEVAVMKKMNPELELDMFPVPPKSADGKATVTTWVDGSFAVNKQSPHKEAALKFLEFMTTKEFGTLVINELQKPSTIPGVTADDPLVSKIAENADTIATPYLFVVHFGAGNPTSKSTLETSLQGMYLEKMTPEQVADEVQKSVDSWFQPQK
ncbi:MULTISPECIES: ABC transporter substrate-binding protein [Paenibacillus]|uniref:ABC transporter substrate-binding protein n=1 Tax=Paenibacillus residui TaxID=629724 RepID=A0ABW3DCH7_9BACL